MQETQDMVAQSPGQENPLEEEMATHSSILAWRIPWAGAWKAIVYVAKSQTQLSDWTGLNCIDFNRPGKVKVA